MSNTSIHIPPFPTTQQLTQTENHSPSATTFTTRTLISSGTNRKFTSCTHGHTKKFFSIPGHHALRNLSRGLAPSRYAIDDKKMVMLTGAKRNWSHATRAAMVRFVVDM